MVSKGLAKGYFRKHLSLIDWIVFYAVLAIFQPYKGGRLSLTS